MKKRKGNLLISCVSCLLLVSMMIAVLTLSLSTEVVATRRAGDSLNIYNMEVITDMQVVQVLETFLKTDATVNKGILSFNKNTYSSTLQSINNGVFPGKVFTTSSGAILIDSMNIAENIKSTLKETVKFEKIEVTLDKEPTLNFDSVTLKFNGIDRVPINDFIVTVSLTNKGQKLIRSYLVRSTYLVVNVSEYNAFFTFDNTYNAQIISSEVQ